MNADAKLEPELDPYHDGWVKGLELAADIAEADKATQLAERIRSVAKNCPGQTLCVDERDEVIEAFSRIAKLTGHDHNNEIFNIAVDCWSYIAYLKRTENSEIDSAKEYEVLGSSCHNSNTSEVVFAGTHQECLAYIKGAAANGRSSSEFSISDMGKVL